MRAKRYAAGTSPSVSGPSVKFQIRGPAQPHQKAVIATPLSLAYSRMRSASSSVHSPSAQLISWQCANPFAAAS